MGNLPCFFGVPGAAADPGAACPFGAAALAEIANVDAHAAKRAARIKLRFMLGNFLFGALKIAAASRFCLSHG